MLFFAQKGPSSVQNFRKGPSRLATFLLSSASLVSKQQQQQHPHIIMDSQQEITDLKVKIARLDALNLQSESEAAAVGISPQERNELRGLITCRYNNLHDLRQQLQQLQKQLAPAPPPAPGKIYICPPIESPPPLYIRTTPFPLYVKTVLSF